MLPKFAPKKGKEESASFLGPIRKDFTVLRDHAEQPGPQDYGADQSKSVAVGKPAKGSKHPFTVNEKRFVKQDHGMPGAGTYELPASIQVKNPK